MDYRISRIKRLINERLDSQITVELLAASVNLSISRTQHLFKSKVGVSISQYIKKKRLEKACYYLLNTDYQIKEICFKVGTCDQSHFCRNFKEKYGKTPTEYRNSLLIE